MAWESPTRFVDGQRRGPYRQWIHERPFTESNGGSEVHDFVRYSVSSDCLVDFLSVRHDVRRLSEYTLRDPLREIRGDGI